MPAFSTCTPAAGLYTFHLSSSLQNPPRMNRSCCWVRFAPRDPHLRSTQMCANTEPRAPSLQPCPFPVTLSISNSWLILNFRHLKSQEAHLASKSLFQGAQRGTMISPRSLGVFVKAGLYPGLFYPDPAQIHFVALALPGGQTSWSARAFALSRTEFCCVNSAAATEKALGG